MRNHSYGDYQIPPEKGNIIREFRRVIEGQLVSFNGIDCLVKDTRITDEKFHLLNAVKIVPCRKEKLVPSLDAGESAWVKTCDGRFYVSDLLAYPEMSPESQKVIGNKAIKYSEQFKEFLNTNAK